MKKTVLIGTQKEYNRRGTAQVDAKIFVTIELKQKPDKGTVLSMTGVVGPLSNGDAYGSCGQIIMSHDIEQVTPAFGWSHDSIKELMEVWERWHMNDARAGCEHQRAAGWHLRPKVTLNTWEMTTETWQDRNRINTTAMKQLAAGQQVQLTAEEQAIVTLPMTVILPDGQEPGPAGAYKLTKSESKHVNWVREDEHPDGILSKPCPTCGYKYGSAWLFEPIPAEVIDYFISLPDQSDMLPGAWR